MRAAFAVPSHFPIRRAPRRRGLALLLALGLGLGGVAGASPYAEPASGARAATAAPAAVESLVEWPENSIKRYLYPVDDLAALQARFESQGATPATALEAPPPGGTRFFELIRADGSRAKLALEQGKGGLHVYSVRLRPQHPRLGLPYRQQEVVFDTPTPGVAPVGTLSYPPGPGPFPAVVLVAGTGPHTRDAGMSLHKTLLVLADHLTRAGYAVLRYDKRGVGLTGGAAHPDSTTDDYASDALAALHFLQRQPFVDPARVGVAGHSEGGIIATMVAAEAPEDVAFIALLGGPGLPGLEVQSLQDAAMRRVAGMDEALIAMNRAQERELLEIAASDLDRAAALAAMHAATAALPEDLRTTLELPAEGLPDEAYEPLLTPWFRRFLALDPRDYLARVQVPVLALIGSKDLQVTPAGNLAELRRVLAANPRAEVRELPGLNHNFQTATTGSLAEYFSIEETFSPEALDVLTGWMDDVTGD